MKRLLKSIIPKKIFTFFQPTYHYLLTVLGALTYGFPSRKLIVIGVTGTKGKSSTAEFINAIFEASGKRTALLSTIRFKVGDSSEPNMLKMTMPGLFFVQRFLSRAVHESCTHAIIEMTSEGVKQFRHKFIDLDALIFTNIEPEHIESHGSFKNYLAAKLKLRDALEHSSKKHTAMIANSDDPHGKDFLAVTRAKGIPFSLNDVTHTELKEGAVFVYNNTSIELRVKGVFNVMNALAALKVAEHMGVDIETIKMGLESVEEIPGRVQHIHEGQSFDVIVDYAHTPDSLKKLYQTFSDKRKICVLGNTGGGRDTWKRPEMGRIAEEYCDTVILTNEDPYDEDPQKILDDMKEGMQKEPRILLDRREAIRSALTEAKTYPGNTVVLISGKGTDPYIMEENGTKTPWSDARVAQEELEKLNKGL